MTCFFDNASLYAAYRLDRFKLESVMMTTLQYGCICVYMCMCRCRWYFYSIFVFTFVSVVFVIFVFIAPEVGVSVGIPYKQLLEDSHPMVASQPSSTQWHRGGLQGGLLEAGHLWAYSFILLPPPPPLCLLMFCFATFGHKQLTSNCHSANSSDTGSASNLVPLVG